ncbi:MAG: RNA 2',3'-cyclic phosphodiesterase [Actinobacteria bacterium]|nr:RNA 2',3'-cyclic phosphodiesterase [Actinomycetota bacterium]
MRRPEQSGGQRERLFIGVPLPDSLYRHIREAQELLPKMGGLRVLKEEQWHVTVAFLGSVGAETGQLVRDIVESIPQGTSGEAWLGSFLMLPSANRARVVTLAIEDDQGVFGRVFEAVMSSLEAAKIMEREKRPFRPHLTIARLRTPGPVKPRSEIDRVRFAVKSVCLYKSELRREGAIYTVLTRRVL